MEKHLIPKSNGKFRTVYCPDPELKRRLRAIVPQLNILAEELDIHHVAHGFTEGRSPLTNAREHIGFLYTVSFDLSDFFDTVTQKHIEKVSAVVLAGSPIKEWDNIYGVPKEDLFPDGAARQGLPTSPALANIAASLMDREIVERFVIRKSRFAEPVAKYTRYADDLTISTNSKGTVDLLLQEIPKIVESHGFKINPSKTKVQCGTAGRRMITGVAVDDKGCYIPRETRRRIRAGEHAAKHGYLKRQAIRRILFNSKRWKRRLPLHVRLRLQLRGLQEWAKLKLPKDYKEQKQGVVMAAITRTVAALVHCKPVQQTLGYFGRKFT